MTLRIGLLAAAKIAPQAVIEPAKAMDDVEVVGVAARDPRRGKEAALEWGLSRSWDSYEALIGSDEVDAIYIGTPAAHHRKWTIAALDAGKHVLVEKPLASNAADGEDMADAAARSDRVAMEAYHWRYHPMVAQVGALLPQIGEVTEVDAHFLIPEGAIPRDDIRWDLTLGGGALMDLGCYSIQWVQWIAGPAPRVTGATAICPVEGIDGSLEASLVWDSGVTGSISASMISDGDFGVGLRIRGTEGEIDVSNPLAPQMGSTITVTVQGSTTAHEVDPSSTYFHQLVAFRDATSTGAPFPTTIAAGVATMSVIDECYRAAGLEPRPVAR